MKRVETLEKKRELAKTLLDFSKSIMEKADKGKISDIDAQGLIGLFIQMQNMI